MFQRPKPGEDENDILKQQEEFLQAKGVNPSASVINKRKSEPDKATVGGGENAGPKPSSKKLKSKFSSSRSQLTPNEGATKVPGVSPVILGEIKERTVSAKQFVAPVSRPDCDGFPRAFRRDKMLTGAGQSIFAQQFAKMRKDNLDVEMDQETVQETVPHEKVIADRSYMLTGAAAADIHRDNLSRLAAMSAEEIREEQQRLLRQLDPKMVEFVRSRRAGGSEKRGSRGEAGGTGDAGADAGSGRGGPGEGATERGAGAVLGEATAAEANRWLHMDVVEEEKLRWMTDLPPAPPVPPDQPYSARFDFEGLLLPYVDESVGVTRALHHHGEEPERPGYTLQELCQLSRSSVLQQRVLALGTIANIIHKTKCGYYDECLQDQLLDQLQDSDIFLLLRFSLDDNTESQLAASLAAIRHLLVSDADEVCLGRLLGGPGGLLQPSLAVKPDPATEQAERDEAAAELMDHQMVKLDVVRGALRTDLVLRLRYILEVLKPGPKAVIHVLEILTRIVRHSHEAALAVTCCPRLMTLIMSQFLPRDWARIVGTGSVADMKSVYGVPLVEALQLVRVIACQSRALASDMVHKYCVMDSVVSYVNIDPRECGLPHKEALRLSLESLYLWQALLAYNLAAQHVSDLFLVLARLLQFHLSATSVGDDGDTSSFGQEHGAAVLSLLEAAVVAAHAQETALAAQRAAAQRDRSPLVLGHEHVRGYRQLLELCVRKWLSQLSARPALSFSSGKLVGSALSCLASYIRKFSNWPGSDVVSQLEDLELLFEKYLSPFVHSPIFTELMRGLRSWSCLLGEGQCGTRRDPGALPSLGALCWGGRQVQPVVGSSSQLALVRGLVSLLSAAHAVHKGLDKQCLRGFLRHPGLLEHLGHVAGGPLATPWGWFARQEVALLCRVVQLAAVCPEACGRRELYHAAGLRLATLAQRQDRPLLARVLRGVVFSPLLLRDTPVLVSRMESLKLSDDNSTSKQKLLTDALTSLPAVRACYEAALGLGDAREAGPLAVASLTAAPRDREPALPADWFYAPVLSLYNQERSGEAASDSAVRTVCSCLQWVFLAECVCPRAAAGVSLTARFCRLCTVFLAASDLFLDPVIRDYLEALLRLMLARSSELDFAEKIPGLSSFYDLYTQLLDQFRAVSYGDKLFGQFLLVPLQQRHCADFRKLAWSEYVSELRLLPAGADELFFPCDLLLRPREEDPSLLACYLNALTSGVVSESQSPVLRRLAAEHVASFVARRPDTPLARQLRAGIDAMRDAELRELLLDKIANEVKSSSS
ncbi:RNA polymerase II-associated protein 1 isoform X2 [Bacillus rossius redtenbacheri]